MTSSITFRKQATMWLESLRKRRNNPVEQTTIDTRRHALDKWILPFHGNTYLAELKNPQLKALVDKMAGVLAPSTIRDYTQIVKAVVASAVNDDGEELFPRKWNAEFIDAPPIGKQNQPASDCAGVSDMRTSNLVEAIRAHKSKGSEANRVIEHFDRLSTQEQQQIIDFLRAL